MPLETFVALRPGTDGAVTPGFSQIWPIELLLVSGLVLQALVAAPVAVATHRFVLLQESRPGPLWAAHTKRFAAWLIIFQLIKHLAVYLKFLAASSSILGLVATIALFTALLWMPLIFPAVAIDAPNTGSLQRMEAALEQTEGNFWLLFRSLFLAAIPLLALLLVIFLPLIIHYGRAGFMQHQTSLPVLLLGAPSTIFTVVLVAAVASWGYAWAARTTR